MGDDSHFDVLIVGGGLVGASLACALGGRRLRVGVVEAYPFDAPKQPSYDDRSIALAYGTRRIFEAMGLWTRLAAASTPIEMIHVSDRGHFGVTRMSAAACGLEALGYVVENRAMGRVFSETLPALSNVELICPGRLKALELTEQGAHLLIDSGGTERALNARLVVGADGGKSMVRTLAGIGARRRDYGQCAVIANISPSQHHRYIAYERFTENGPLALLPMSEGRCSLVWTVPATAGESMVHKSDTQFLDALQARFGRRLGRLERVGKRAAYPLALVRAHRHTATRLALIGNAAHSLHPVAGQGFNLGLRDVAVLVEALIQAVEEGRDPGSREVLHRYEHGRRRDQRRVSALTDGLVRVFSNDFTPLVLARNAGMVAVDLMPPLKRALMRQTMGLAGRLPRLARGLSL